MKHKGHNRDDTIVLDGKEYNLQFLNFCDLLTHLESLHEQGVKFKKKKKHRKEK